MDLDILNALQILYQNGETKWDALLTKLWCGPDSDPDVEGLFEKASD